MTGEIIVRVAILVYRVGFIAITLPWFLLKTAFMWFFFYKKPEQMYIDWLKSVLKHVRSDAYPSKPIPKMKFVEIKENSPLVYMEDEVGKIIFSIGDTPFTWFSMVVIPLFLVSILCLSSSNGGELGHDNKSLFMHSFFVYTGTIVSFIWIAYFGFKYFYRKIFEPEKKEESNI
ncbi:hypothetical protein GW764_03960 [Candidatus Parcubacteria bacterium]|nr:hypothetical protein [Candidatus Parcubacteria bacterium]